MAAKTAACAAVAGTLPSSAWAALGGAKSTTGLDWVLTGLEWEYRSFDRTYDIVAGIRIKNGPAWFDQWMKEEGSDFMAQFRVGVDVLDDSEISVERFFIEHMRPTIELDVAEIPKYSDKYQWLKSDPTYQYTPESWEEWVNRQQESTIPFDERIYEEG